MHRRGALMALAAWLAHAPATQAQGLMQLRIGTVAPKGSSHHQQLLEMGEAWRAAQGPGAKVTVFTDGSQGGEHELLRRLRIGQLQGAMMTVVGLRDIEPSVSALQNLPLLFRSWDEVDAVREKLRAGLEKRFLDKGFVVVAWGDAGWVRFFSKTAAVRPDDFKPLKFFSWGPETEQQALMKGLGYTPVPLETNDVLPALQTGMIQVVPTTPYFALATQVFGPAPHMLDLNWAPVVGAVVVTAKAWEAMSPAAQVALKAAGEKAGVAIRAAARREVEESVEAMRKRGLQVHKPTPEQLKEWTDLAEKLYPKLRGSLVPAETFDEVMAHVKAVRGGR
ncbi:TRAP transporter substrate-binding protein DctP [Inhella sp. 4Y17]|uniref:TRAP transporter substrate-binding protein DctP n=2 Tax=Inhella gelatinilytica TaxID=2795030 RepID=A0A931IX60_9BURK|nr:TRAP transporter substrate-binding protein DctP [Inhella gelatinilytica]